MKTHDTTTHAFVMAGGNGSRLHPLTEAHCKPSLPFAADHRVIDYVLGNLRCSGVPGIDVLVQYRPQSLCEHLARAWPRADDAPEPALRIVTPAQPWRGTADAVRRNLDRLPKGCDTVVVFGADHVYRMDVAQMVAFHAATGADVTVAMLPVELDAARSFGVAEVDDADRIRAFHEKPADPPPAPGRPGMALASMGNYVFGADVLRRELDRGLADDETDFGQHVLPRLVRSHRVTAYDFRRQTLPIAAPHEEPHYWRDIGTLSAYFAAHMDTLGPAPRFAAVHPAWPMRPPPEGPAAFVLDSDVASSCFGRGAIADRAALDHAVVGRGARIRRGARLERAILFDDVVVGARARLRNVIVDAANAIPPGEVIGEDAAADRARFPVTADGIVVVPRGHYARPASGPPADARGAALHG